MSDLSPKQLNDAAILMRDGMRAEDALMLASTYGGESRFGWYLAGIFAVVVLLAIGLVALFSP